jgi:hypothetical protein
MKCFLGFDLQEVEAAELCQQSRRRRNYVDQQLATSERSSSGRVFPVVRWHIGGKVDVSGHAGVDLKLTCELLLLHCCCRELTWASGVVCSDWLFIEKKQRFL